MEDEIEIIINGQTYTAEFKQFKTGREGFGLYRQIEIDGEVYRVCLNIIKLY